MSGNLMIPKGAVPVTQKLVRVEMIMVDNGPNGVGNGVILNKVYRIQENGQTLQGTTTQVFLTEKEAWSNVSEELSL